MAAETKKEIELEIAHILFLDIVGYSKLSVNDLDSANAWHRSPFVLSGLDVTFLGSAAE